MKTYFKRLFDYDLYANGKMLQLMAQMDYPPNTVRLFAHILMTQQVWIRRCNNEPVIAQPWPDWQHDVFDDTIKQNHQLVQSFLESLADDDFARVITYKNTKGESFENTITDILAHVVNHGTHHRAQIGQHLKAAGLENLPMTDYIFYIREQQTHL